jgi:hypothetical protein
MPRRHYGPVGDRNGTRFLPKIAECVIQTICAFRDSASAVLRHILAADVWSPVGHSAGRKVWPAVHASEQHNQEHAYRCAANWQVLVELQVACIYRSATLFSCKT